MAGCCSTDYRRFFNRKQARRDARRYRRKGLDPSSRRVAELAGGVEGATVLEVGGGIGAIELELLARGAAHATNVELSAGYEDEAKELLRERGLEGRVERQIGDFVEQSVEPADVVVMDRVVCCYPDYAALLGAAAERTRRRLVFSFPREAWWTKAALRVLNLWLALNRCGFRTYVHSVDAMLAAAQQRGLRVDAIEQAGFFWRVAALERA